MNNFERRLSALEAGKSDPEMAAAIYHREPDVTAWLISDSGTAPERSAVWGEVLAAVDGRSRGLPNALHGEMA
jgi:hypothetical protein